MCAVKMRQQAQFCSIIVTVCVNSWSGQIWLWVDSICIDQSNVEEKAQQIVLMPEIFNNAWSVTIWLGENKTSERTAQLAVE